MVKRSAAGEMPFLEHLEELRWRILWSLAALIIGTVVGFLLVQHFAILGFLKRPIDPFLPSQRLAVISPTDAFMITFKLAVSVGIVLASPIVTWQAWTFLSPALYQREKRYIVPVLLAGLLLFGVGVVIAYVYVLPAAMKILFSFQSSDLTPVITADAYFSFVIQLLLAFGLVFEIPLVMVLLAMFGIVNPAFFAKNRNYAIVVAAVAAALLTPGPDAFSMLMMMVPLLVLYELGILVARLVWRARARARSADSATTILLLAALCAGWPSTSSAQGRVLPTPPVPKRDSARAGQGPAQGPGRSGNTGLDTAAARRLGLPAAPSRAFPDADSTMRALMARAGYRLTRFVADSVALHGQTKRIDFSGTRATPAVVEREGSTLEADTVRFAQGECRLSAGGAPKAFDKGTVLVGEGMRYDTCEQRGTVTGALTNFNQTGTEWYLRAHGLETDSGSTRIYDSDGTITSSDLPIPDYHFATHEMKWVKNTILVARPAVLYVRDVPVLWLPFMFQDMRQGRHTGMLVPRFGVNDLVRPNQGYHRHVANIGYYFALSDYLDAQASMDWFPGSYVSANGEVRYKWLNRFVTGGLAASRIYESGTEAAPGGRSLSLRWNHQQNFDLRTGLTAQVDYASSAKVVQRNTLNPALSLASLRSNINFHKQFDWGTVSMGGNRSQDLTNGAVTQTLPSLSLTPVGISLSETVTWSPSMSFSNQRTIDQPTGAPLPLPPVGGQLRVDTLLLNSRTTNFSLETPLRIGNWNWQNSVSVNDQISNQRTVQSLPDPTDSTKSSTRYYGIDFSTGVDWSTGINLPAVFPSTWKLQPSIGIANATGGTFLLKNRYTDGRFVSQGKRLTLGAQVSPTVFGFLPGVGPLARIRHSLSPLVRWTYAPAADVPADYAHALDPSASGSAKLRSEALQTLGFSLSQNFEGKLRPDPGDTTADPAKAPKLKILSVQTSELQYDIEQAKLPGRTGWRTQNISNQFTSDLLPGFSLQTTHDLWRGVAGSDSAQFDPFLTSVSVRFGLSGGTLADVFGLVTGTAPAHRPAGRSTGEAAAPPAGLPPPDLDGPRTSPASQFGQPGLGGSLARHEMTASVTYDEQRVRSLTASSPGAVQTGNNRSVGLTFSFSPTENWAVSWQTQYNLTTSQFGEHIVRLERDLRRWRATFNFVKAPNGNFAFNFYITLLDQPDIKFDYQQQTLQHN
jgi:Tat protein translocase TatC